MFGFWYFGPGVRVYGRIRVRINVMVRVRV